MKKAIKEENKPELSIIIPFAGEYPQVLFTIQAVAQSLLTTGLDFEILAVDNHCMELEQQWQTANTKASYAVMEAMNERSPDSEIPRHFVSVPDFKKGLDQVPRCHQSNKAGEAIKAAAKGNPWLRYIAFDGWLSHWECKRIACEEAKADTFLFLDAHVVPSAGIDKMYHAYQYFRGDGTFHMPLTYKILEWRKLIYKLVIENDFWGYSFTGYQPTPENQPLEVPCMSTCGMMISREIYDSVGGWPKYMLAYGGGENFINYALSYCGYNKWIFPAITLHHHGEKRDYHYTFDGQVWNRMVAHYLFGGKDILEKMLIHQKGRPEVLDRFKRQIYSNHHYKKHRDIIKENGGIDLMKWRADWEKRQDGK